MNQTRRTEYLLYVLSKHKSYVRSSDLAKEIGISVRTIKYEMVEVNKLASSYGCHIEATKSKGYLLVEDNPNVFIQKMGQLELSYRTGTKKIMTKDADTLDLCRLIVSGHLFSSVEEIAKELYLSENSVRNKLHQLEAILDNYYLYIEKNKNTGYFTIFGEEYNIRCFILYLLDDISDDHVFYKQWLEDTYIQKEIRNIILNILIDTKYHLTDALTRKLERYILISNNRKMVEKQVFFDADTKKIVQTTKAYFIAKEIYLRIHTLFDYVYSENEIIGLSLFLLTNRDVSLEDDIDKETSFLDEQANKIKVVLDKKDENWVMMDLNTVKIIFYPILMRNYFRVPIVHVDYSVTVAPNAIKASPFSVYYSRCLVRLLKKKFDFKMYKNDTYHIAKEILKYILTISYTYSPIKVAICSVSGIASAELLKEIIMKRYSELAIAEVVELYELRNRKKEDFDVVISDFSGFIYRYDWEHVSVNTVPTKKEMDLIYNSLILNSLNLESIVKKMEWNKIETFDNFNFHDEESLVDLFAYKLASEPKNVVKIQNEIQDAMYCTENEVAIFYVNRKYTKEGVFQLYHLKNAKKIGENKVDYILVMSTTNTAIGTRFMNDLTFTLLNNRNFVEHVFKEGNVSAVCDCVKDALKSVPISLTSKCTY